ncbi:efflux RND transporter periplasmic adaptor subunit [Kangiella sediminilitoris]|uniref:Efflux transporter, RND family, MFP subunit n=1 Tax=Kangiella sediminilitoris TaxID=1144748 RepID=A0A1B3B8L1_9GAMM|nr:efflux RND transporter periplasmic adaptor subunit [Kangiella sediminilitoris]AOE49133.1 Efflux transporter, RND family, MFP subunit [Kangiella sediminilitoris]
MSSKKKNLWLSMILPLAILIVVIVTINIMLSNKPKAFNRKPPERVETVDVDAIKYTDYQVFIDSYGNIEASTSSELVAQVSGQVVSVAENFETGLPIEKGQELLKIDDRDFQIEVRIARAEVANARLTLNEERAMAEQALKDWKKINPDKKANALVLREPQLASAQAKLDAAIARLEKAKLELERTTVIAPYDGYIVRRMVSQGESVNTNTPVARIFASNSLEVRLPVPSNKVQFLKEPDGKAQVKLQADFAGSNKTWIVPVDRSDSVIDEQTRQWYITAKLPADFLEKNPRVKVGQFVSAEIEGRLLKDIVLVPSRVLTADDKVFIYKDDAVYRRDIKILWQDDKNTIVAPLASDPGLDQGQLLVTSKLTFVADGAKAKLKEPVAESKEIATDKPFVSSAAVVE